MRFITWFALLVFATLLFQQVIAADSLSTSTERGPVADFDGDGHKDTLFVTAQHLDRDGRRVARRLLPAYIAWFTARAKTADTTRLEIDTDTKAAIGARVVDANGDGAVDIELLYRWSPAKSAKDRKPGKPKDDRVEEKIWLIEGGATLRDMETVDVRNGRSPSRASISVLSDRTTTSRSAETHFGIGGFSVRRIGGRAEMPKQRPAPDDNPAQSPEASITVRPNPVRDRMEISWDVRGTVTDVDVVDLEGRVVLSLPAENVTSGIDMRTLPAGTYLVRIQGCTECPRSTTIVVVR